MPTKIFVNLPVKDLKRSIQFFEKLGYSFNPQFTDETAACMVISDDIYAMLLTHEKFREFTSKEIADSNKACEVITCLSFDSKEDVNRVADQAIAAGGSEPRPASDYGFMYGRTFLDPDGHAWEAIWMDPAFAQSQPAVEQQPA